MKIVQILEFTYDVLIQLNIRSNNATDIWKRISTTVLCVNNSLNGKF